MSTLEILLGIVAVACIVIDALRRPVTPENRAVKEREDALKKRQEAAVERMKRDGIKSLLDGRPAWARINPMGVAPESKKVVRIKGRA